MSDALERRGVKLDGTLNAGHLLTCIVLVAGFTTWLYEGRGEAGSAQREVQELKRVVADQAAGTRTALAETSANLREGVKESVGRIEAAVRDVQTHLEPLPALTERLRTLEQDVRRLQESDANMEQRIEARRTSVDGRIDALRQTVIEVTAQLDALRRASGVNLPGAPGIRPR